MSEIPVSAAAHRKQLQIIPLGDDMPYDFRRPHRHEYFEFFVFAQGGGAHFIDFTEYTIQENSVHIVFPGQIHLLKRAGAKGLIIVCAREFMDSLSKAFYWHLFERSYAAPCITTNKDSFSALQGAADQLYKELMHEQLLSEELLRSHMSVFLATCVRSFQSMPLSHNQEHQRHDLLTFQQFAALLDSHLSDKHGVSFYASKMAITPKALNNSIRRLTGKTCIDLIQERTLTEAKRLLLYTDKSAKEIAYELNFKDNSYFTRFFSKHTGHTPSTFKSFWEEKYHA